ncbi:PfkB family carbohydrate kinase [Jonesia quinghaiensis]|uniref:PfkB family carbohydrate kinase n=1 Tax=Jonesia quinghaiensis TaxID=262806 RepID=UPI00040E6379|nr:PfkB family carbohydrate kinase [Jonesia quinghaiensis]
MTTHAPTGLFVGLSVLDIINRVEAPPGTNKKVTATQQAIAAGGPAANAAVTFAALGGHAILVTALGEAPVAGLARADLEAHNVTVIDCAPPTYQLSVSAVTVTESTGDRSVVSTDARPLTVSSDTAAALRQNLETIAPLDVVLIDGHHPELAHTVLDVLSQRALDIPVVIDAGRWKPQFTTLIPRGNHVIASADFHDPHGWVPANLSAPSTLPGGPTVVRTHGAQPVMWWNGEHHGTVQPPRVTAQDTLGAGDVFHGAYAHYLAANPTPPSNIERAITAAATTAAHRVSSIGPRQWIATLPV